MLHTGTLSRIYTGDCMPDKLLLPAPATRAIYSEFFSPVFTRKHFQFHSILRLQRN